MADRNYRITRSSDHEGPWFNETTTLDKAALEAASREFSEIRHDDPDRLVYGRRLKSDLTVSATCGMIPQWEFNAGHLARVIEVYQSKAGR